jgi:opacity protein-like surface antigen
MASNIIFITRIKLMKLSNVFVAGTLAAIAMTAQAQAPVQSLYGELAYTSAGVQLQDMNGTKDYPVLRGILGYQINNYLAVEGMLGFGVSDRNDTLIGIPVKSKIDHTYGIFVKPQFQINDSISIFARAGYARTKVSYEEPGYSESKSHGSFAYGAGATYSFTPQMYLNVDYMSYYDKNNSKAHGPSIGLGYKF